MKDLGVVFDSELSFAFPVRHFQSVIFQSCKFSYPKYTHSRVVCLRLEGNVVYFVSHRNSQIMSNSSSFYLWGRALQMKPSPK